MPDQTERLLLISSQHFGKDLAFQGIDVHVVFLQHRKPWQRSDRIDPEAEHQFKVRLRQKVTSSMYSSRSRAFLKSYSLARRLSSQMYSCREAQFRGKPKRPQVLRAGAPDWLEASHLYEAVGVEQRHSVRVLQLLLQQLPR